jgi:transposase
VGSAPSGVARPLGRRRPDRLESRVLGLGQHGGQQGGELTGPNPTDRGKPGSKRHLVVDRTGIPLAALLSGANRHDSVVFEQVLDAIPPIRQPNGRRRKRPAKLHADKGYDYPRCRQALRRRHIRVRIARKGVDSSERLGRHRWVVERTLAWLNRYRRLTVRYERRADIHQAVLTLGCALICYNTLQRGF